MIFMKITCAQMDVLISFYIEGDLSKTLREKVEEHLRECSACRSKYDIIKTMIKELHESVENKSEEVSLSGASNQYRIFKSNLSAYVDNELSQDENIKIKKFTINNKNARKELEDTFNIRKLMNDSFQKTKLDAKQDFSKNILKQLNIGEDECNLGFHPVLKVAIAFVLTVLVLSAIIVFSLML